LVGGLILNDFTRDYLVSIDFGNKATQILDYSGWNLERHFCPTLIVQTSTHEKIVFEGYERVWQLLDTVCFEQPLGRRNFNPILKHRLDNFDETSLDIIRGVISEGDTKKIMVQGEKNRNGWFVVDFTYQNFTDDIQPALFDISILLDSENCDQIVFSNYEFIKRGKEMDFKRTSITAPSIIAIYSLTATHKHIIRVVQMPSGKLGFLTNTINQDRKYACIEPHLFDKDEIESIIRYISYVKTRSHKVLTALSDGKLLPLWKQERTVGSTTKHFSYNVSLLEQALY
jgi:hypothetical protein